MYYVYFNGLNAPPPSHPIKIRMSINAKLMRGNTYQDDGQRNVDAQIDGRRRRDASGVGRHHAEYTYAYISVCVCVCVILRRM